MSRVLTYGETVGLLALRNAVLGGLEIAFEPKAPFPQYKVLEYSRHDPPLECSFFDVDCFPLAAYWHNPHLSPYDYMYFVEDGACGRKVYEPSKALLQALWRVVMEP